MPDDITTPETKDSRDHASAAITRAHDAGRPPSTLDRLRRRVRAIIRLSQLDSVADEFHERIRIRQVEKLGRLLRLSAATGVATLLVLIAAFWRHGVGPVAAPWFAVTGGAYLTLFLFSRHADRVNRRQGEAGRLIGIYNLILLALGLVWAVLFISLMASASPGQRPMLYGLAIALLSIGPLKSPLSTAITFSVPVGLASLVSLFVGAGPVDVASLCLLAAYAMLTGIEVVAQNRQYLLATKHEFEIADQADTISLLLSEYEESSSDWLWSVDERMRLSRISGRLPQVLGQPEERLVGMPMAAILRGEIDPGLRLPEETAMLLASMERRARFARLAVPMRINGEQRWWMLTGKPLFDKFGRFTGYRGIGADITSARRSEEKITRLARYDSLTGLANRPSFSDMLREICDRPGRTSSALLCLDLDDFKAVNDTHGHTIGDKVLAEVARRLHGMLRKPDLAARFGGDEFAVLIREADRDAALTLASRIIERLCQPVVIDGITAEIGASIGIAMIPSDGTNAELLLSRADLALYCAKGDGRRTSRFFEQSMDDQLRERQILRADLRRALARGEFVLNLQPLIDLDTLKVSGFEALTRWSHPERGEIGPTLFIPIAEEARLIDQLGAWALRSACTAARNWPESVRIAVNLSPLQFRDPALPKTVEAALAASGLPADRLELELTESILLDTTADSSASLHALRGLGIRLVLDDFGAGYSSFHYLRDFHFDKIKIDRSYVRDIAHDTRAQALVEGLIVVARKLGIDVTAEGVETVEQMRQLRLCGCTEAQGFYFTRPHSVSSAEAYLARTGAVRRGDRSQGPAPTRI